MMVFYDIFVGLCREAGKAPTVVLAELGMSKGNLGKWRDGRTPKADGLVKIADYFGVTTDFLTGKGQKEKPADDGGPETLDELREVLRQNGVRILLDADAKDFTPEEIREIANFIKFKRGQRDG